MFNLNNLFSSRFDQKASDKMLTVHMDTPGAVFQLAGFLSKTLKEMDKKGPPIILCIGTDRSTGDSFGPLTGWHLTSLLRSWNLPIYGTLEHPVHAVNLAETIQGLPNTETRPVIALDACLGQISPVGSIIVKKEPLQPGMGLKKKLPAVGDISISGIVNIGGYMEFQILQNTRLNLVFKMAQLVARSIFLTIQSTYPELRRGDTSAG